MAKRIVKITNIDYLDDPDPAISFSYLCKISYKDGKQEKTGIGMSYMYDTVVMGIIFIDDEDQNKVYIHKYGTSFLLCKNSIQGAIDFVVDAYKHMVTCGCSLCLININNLQKERFKITPIQIYDYITPSRGSKE